MESKFVFTNRITENLDLKLKFPDIKIYLIFLQILVVNHLFKMRKWLVVTINVYKNDFIFVLMVSAYVRIPFNFTRPKPPKEIQISKLSKSLDAYTFVQFKTISYCILHAVICSEVYSYTYTHGVQNIFPKQNRKFTKIPK